MFPRFNFSQRRKSRPHETLQQSAIGPAARENTNAKQDTKQEPREIFRRLRSRDCFILLSGDHTSQEKGLDLRKKLGDDALKLRIVRREFKGGIYQHATAPKLIVQRALDDFFQESDQSLPRRKVAFEAPDAFAECRVQIVFKRSTIEGTLATKRIVQAGTGDPHAVGQIPD